MTDKQCHCESCKRTPYFDSLSAKATPEEKEALDWLWAEMEDASMGLVFAQERYNTRLLRRRKISKALRSRLSERDRQIAELLRQLQALQERCKQLQACHDSEIGLCHQYCDEVLELKQLLRDYVDAAGPVHEPDCPEDDTCSCKWKPLNDRLSNALAQKAERDV